MVFTTLKFMVFMAVVFWLYYLVPKKWQWKLLLLASYIFYACASPIYIFFLIFTTVVTYVGSVGMARLTEAQDAYLEQNGKNLEKEEKKAYKKSIEKKRKYCLGGVIASLLLLLIVFKYSIFILKNMTGLLGIFGVTNDWSSLNIILPVGLSFYIFQSMGYCIDVYREMAQVQKNIWKHALYVSFFPQLLQGPLGDYNTLAPQLFEEKEFDYAQCVNGLQRVAWGFFKKLVIANQISLIIDNVWNGYEGYYGLIFVFALFLYSFQLYADFSGYMDIANGCAQMLGITLEENFITPYFSRSIAEFWRKWHITLGTWFKNYVFYSILRTEWCSNLRKKYKKTHPYLSVTLPNIIALSIVWLLIGIWHGADWSYVVYGIFHGSFVVLATVMEPLYTKFHEKYPGLAEKKAFQIMQVVRTFCIVTFGYVIFRPADLEITKTILMHMFTKLDFHALASFGLYYFKELVIVLAGIVILVLVDIYHYRTENSSIRSRINAMIGWKRWSIYTVFLLVIIFFGAYGTSSLNQFAYFKF